MFQACLQRLWLSSSPASPSLLAEHTYTLTTNQHKRSIKDEEEKVFLDSGYSNLEMRFRVEAGQVAFHRSPAFHCYQDGRQKSRPDRSRGRFTDAVMERRENFTLADREKWGKQCDGVKRNL